VTTGFPSAVDWIGATKKGKYMEKTEASKVRKEILAAFDTVSMKDAFWKHDYTELLKRLVWAVVDGVMGRHGLKVTEIRLVGTGDVHYQPGVSVKGISALLFMSDCSSVSLYIRTANRGGYKKVVSVGYLWDVQLNHASTGRGVCTAYSFVGDCYGKDAKEAALTAMAYYDGAAPVKTAVVSDFLAMKSLTVRVSG